MCALVLDTPQPAITFPQPVQRYDAEDHAVWRHLFQRQARLVADRACPDFLRGLKLLGLNDSGIPDFERLSDRLEAATGWRLACVEGFLPDSDFFHLLAARRFPVTWWIRPWAKLDYLQEPDVFHDLFGHVPLLAQPVFADYMQAFGQGGLKAERLGALHRLARLYWYSVEFGLIQTPDGPRIHGAGILSSKGESVFCLDSPAPNRVGFDLRRIMRTRYRIDTFQKTYFVIRDFEQLFEATRPDFAPIYADLEGLPDLAASDLLPEDVVITRGSMDRVAGGWLDETPDT
ncbi:phenylalanine 4-monooxygenase [Ferrovibrio sp.]|uniref:phenylalanine 4-monooxygenase n=1 Tax=Ferrovibrio sp. TaxID=1917215 RepID=UPI0025BD9C1E|nr:phenylalanine 4-monooxygenase [Ferrovibrio sp.]MBX3453382.1 phenylalanine 4-monooxygenase [Ferrovibrio sp.]